METLESLFNSYGPGIFIPFIILALIGVIGQWSLYDRCKQPGIACIVPVWNVVVFMKIIGRPAWHSLIVMIPPIIVALGIYMGNIAGYSLAALAALIWIPFMIYCYIDVCNSFGKTKQSDYIMCILFNGFYVLNLGLSSKVTYKGPSYGKKYH